MPLARLVNATARDVAINGVVGSYLIPRPLRWRLLRWAGMRVEQSYISAKCFFGGRGVSIGKGTFVNYGVFFDCADSITIGTQCQIGMEVLFCTGTHEMGPASQRGGAPRNEPIVVGDGAWIGARAVILPGVTVGAGAVVAAGSVVREDVAPNHVVAGVPARTIEKLD